MPFPSGRPQARPTIFCASEKPRPVSGGLTGSRNSPVGASFSASRALAVRPRPMISGMRPPARTSSSSTSDLSSNSAITSPSFSALPSYGRSSMTSPCSIFDTSSSIGSAPASSMVL